MLAAKVRAKALRAQDGHFGNGFAIQYSNKTENMIIPIVDPADNAKETDTEVEASRLIKIIMHIPNAFSGAGRRLLKNANNAMYAIKAARRADIGIAAQMR